MSVMEANDDDYGTVLQYAPRHVRSEEERSIRSVLERLKGEGLPPDDVPEEPRAHDPVVLEPPRRKIGWQLITCSVISAGLSAALAVLAVGWLAPAKTDFARTEIIQLVPKFIRTVVFQHPQAAPEAGNSAPKAPDAGSPAPKQEKAKMEEPPAAATEAASAPPDAEAAPHKTEPQRDRMPTKDLHALWSGVPADMASEASANPLAASPPDLQQPAEFESEAKAEAEAPPPARAERRQMAQRPRAHARHHRPRRAHVARPRVRQEAAAAEAAAEPPAPSNPIHSALQAIFGGRPAANTQPPQPRQP